jgi:hypothetical protein
MNSALKAVKLLRMHLNFVELYALVLIVAPCRYVHSRRTRDDKPALKCFKIRRKPIVFRIQVLFQFILEIL